MSRNILVVDDEKAISDLIRTNLRQEGYRVSTANDGKHALNKIDDGSFDLVILDLVLPETDGLQVCRQIRSRPDYIAVLMVTGKSSEVDRVIGLEMGADDYLVKPFSMLELVSRVKAIFRRMDHFESRSARSEVSKLNYNDLSIDMDTREVRLSSTIIDLTVKEYELLVHFVKHPGRVYTRSQLMDSVWGYNHPGCDHTVNSHINRLRAKIEGDAKNPRYIQTVWGVGYKFSADEN